MQVVAVAASGGRDSTALLHCTARQGAQLGVRVVALHVHHGLMPQADTWQQQVRAQARRWGAGFATLRLQGGPQAGDSIEAWARRARYAALATLAHDAGAGLVLLAHHRRDQAETWMLQALRGGGPRGLSAMPKLVQREGLVWARPWLDMPRESIDTYLRRHRLRCADDHSNADPRFARSRLRTAVWPALLAAFDNAETALVGAAARAQEAAALADEMAATDLPLVQGAKGLLLLPWQGLPPARRLNVLRAWLAAQLGQGAPESLVQRLVHELPHARSAQWPAGPGRALRSYKGVLALAACEAAQAAARAPWRAPADPPAHGADAASPPPATVEALQSKTPVHDFSAIGDHPLPDWGGTLRVSAADIGGVAVGVLKSVCLRQRTGGESFQRHAEGPPRSLKLQFQSAAVPAWERQVPLFCAADGRLLFVPGLGLDARCLAPAGTPQRLLQWLPAGPA